MSEPTDEELQRAERVRRLRTGGATSQSYRRRQRREAERADATPAETDADAGETSGGEDDAGPGGDATGSGEAPGSGDGPDPADVDLEAVARRNDVIIVEFPEGVPEGYTVVPFPVPGELRRELNRVSEAQHMRYGFAYRSELDRELHVRPLALYLGLQQLEGMDAEAVHEVMVEADELDAPD